MSARPIVHVVDDERALELNERQGGHGVLAVPAHATMVERNLVHRLEQLERVHVAGVRPQRAWDRERVPDPELGLLPE